MHHTVYNRNNNTLIAHELANVNFCTTISYTYCKIQHIRA